VTLTKKKGSLFDSDAPALAHGVNCHGVMGAGIARLFRDKYPSMYFSYKEQCRHELILPGMSWLWKNPDGPHVFNLASQDLPGADARTHWLRRSLNQMIYQAGNAKIDRIALPEIGCGIGGLTRSHLYPLLEQAAKDIDLEVWVL
jgi:O-acetyl-ADP-ribose deacetylase (regulator of RNase III)